MKIAFQAQRMCVALLVLLGSTSTAHAQISNWTSLATGNWSDPGNWDALPASSATTSLVFGATGAISYTATNDLSNPFLLNAMTFNNAGTGLITIAPAAGGGAITFTGTGPQILNNGSGPVAISAPLNLGANTVFAGTGTGTVTVSGGVSDGGLNFGLNTGGAGNYTFSAGTNSLNFLRVDAGTTQVTGGAWTVNSATDNATASLVVGTTAGQTGTFNLSGGATFTSSAGNIIIGDPATSTGNALITGAGTMVTATNATLGRIAVGNSGTGSLTVSAGAVVNARLSTIGRNAGSSGTVTIDGATTQWNSAGTFGIGAAGTGTVTVQNGATGATTGTAQTQIGNTGTGTLTIQSGGHWTSAGTTFLGIGANGIGNLTVTGAGSTFATGGTSGIQAGNAATSTGNISVQNGGQVTSGGTIFLGVNANSTGTLSVSGTGSSLSTTGTANLIAGGGATPGGAGNVTLTSGGLINVNNATFAQNAGSTSTSVVDAATLTVRNQFLVASSGVATLTIQNGGVATVGGTGFVGSAGGSNGTVTVTGANSSLTGSAAGFLIFGGGATPGGTGNLNVLAGGTVTGANINLGQNASSVGTAIIDAATLTANTQLAVGQAGNGSLTVQNAGTVTAGGNVFVATAAGVTGTITVTGSNSTMTVTNQLQLGGSGTTAGGTGTLNVLAGGSVTGSERLLLFAGGSAVVNAGTLSVGALADGVAAAQSGGVSLTNTTLTITNGLGLTYNGAISGNGSLVKQGAGIQTLSGTNTYSGTTSVTAGTLLMNGTLDAQTSAVTVSGTGTLGGTGTINRPVNIQTGATLKPGASPGVLTVNNAVTMATGSIFAGDIQGITPGNGTNNHAQLIVTGGLTLNNPTLNLTFSGYTPAPSDQIEFVRYTGGALTGTFNGLPDGSIAFSNVLGSGVDYRIWYGSIPAFGSSIVLSPVPEPLNIFLMCGGTAVAIRWWRRKQSGSRA